MIRAAPAASPRPRLRGRLLRARVVVAGAPVAGAASEDVVELRSVDATSPFASAISRAAAARRRDGGDDARPVWMRDETSPAPSSRGPPAWMRESAPAFSPGMASVDGGGTVFSSEAAGSVPSSATASPPGEPALPGLDGDSDES